MSNLLRDYLTILVRRCGKTYTPDPALPISFIVKTLLRRGLWLLRGLLRCQQFAFIGPHVTIDGAANLKLGSHATLDPYVSINAIAGQPVTLGRSTRIGAYSRVLCTAHLSKVGQHFTMGDQSGCGEFCFFGVAGGITIGRNVIMGQYVSMHAQDHVFANMTKPIQHQATTEKGIVIGDDCWIGAKVTILDGTTVGTGCVIAAGAVMKGDFPDNCIIGGVPAKIIKMRDA